MNAPKLILATILLFLAVKPAIADRYAVLIGVSDYEHGQITDLPFADRDVDRIKDGLVRYAHVKPENITVLRSRPNAAVGERVSNWNNIRLSISGLTSLKTTDELFIYFSGHGTAYKGEDKNELALLPQDAQFGNAPSYITIDRDLRDWTNNIGATKYVILDACYVGGNNARGITQGGRSIEVPDFSTVTTRNYDVYLSASGADEIAIDDPQSQSGLFTHYFVEGLAKANDLQRENRLTVDHLMSYVTAQVTHHTNDQQHPSIVTGHGHVIVDNSIGFVTITSDPPGAQIEVAGHTFPSDQQPRTPQADLQLPVGRHILSLSLGDSYKTERDVGFTVNPGYRNQPRHYQISHATGTVQGRVVDSERKGIPGVTVRLLGGPPSTTAPQVVTDVNGNYRIEALLGTYSGVVVQPPAGSPYVQNEWTPPTSLVILRESIRSVDPITLQTPMHSLSITSNPPDAEVWIDDESIGMKTLASAPLIVPSITPGAHVIRLQRPDTRAWVGRFTVLPDRTPDPIHADLEILYGRIDVTARDLDGNEVRGADVYVNNVRVGSTPLLNQRLAIGDQTVEVRHPHYKPTRKSVSIRQNISTPHSVILPSPDALTLALHNPERANVTLNGIAVGAVPKHEEAVRPGQSVRVTARRPGYEPWEENMVVTTDRPLSIYIDPVPKSRWKASLRSLALPSWGQYYSERNRTGTFFLVSTIAAGGITAYFVNDFFAKNDDYEKAWDAYDDFVGDIDRLEELKTARDNALTKRDDAAMLANYAIIGFGTVWALNVFDSLIRFPSLEDWGIARNSSIEVAPTVVAQSPGIGVGFQFVGGTQR